MFSEAFVGERPAPRLVVRILGREYREDRQRLRGLGPETQVRTPKTESLASRRLEQRILFKHGLHPQSI